MLTTSRFVIKTTLAGSDVIPGQAGALTWALSDTPAYSEFTGLFDQYKINRVQYRFVLRRNPDYSTNATYAGYTTRIMFVVDNDDSATPANFAELQQYPKVRELFLNDNRPVTRWFSHTPKVQMAMYNNVGTTAYGPKANVWIDTSSASVQHYGVKYVYDQLYAGISVFIEAKYSMSFKDPK